MTPRNNRGGVELPTARKFYCELWSQVSGFDFQEDDLFVYEPEPWPQMLDLDRLPSFEVMESAESTDSWHADDRSPFTWRSRCNYCQERTVKSSSRWWTGYCRATHRKLQILSEALRPQKVELTGCAPIERYWLSLLPFKRYDLGAKRHAFQLVRVRFQFADRGFTWEAATVVEMPTQAILRQGFAQDFKPLAVLAALERIKYLEETPADKRHALKLVSQEVTA